MEGEKLPHEREIKGTPNIAPKPISEAEAWATTQNPVRETPPAFTNLREVK